MAKKKKKHKLKKRTTNANQTALQSKKRSKFPLVASIAGGVLILIGIYFLYPEEKPTQQLPVLSEMKKANFNLQENRPTLSPQRFSGTFRLAYEVARAIPEVLDRLYCYCRCQENLGHINLLSCYVDTHAST
jgi:hypothetical protein